MNKPLSVGLSSADLQACRPAPESHTCYSRVVAILNGRWRVIECRDRIQWILQVRNRAETVATDVWRGRSYCRPPEALLRCCDEHADAIDPGVAVVLAALPGRITAPTQSQSPNLDFAAQRSAANASATLARTDFSPWDAP